MNIQQLFDNKEHTEAVLSALVERFAKNPVMYQLFKIAVEERIKQNRK